MYTKLHSSESAQTLVEYSLIMGLIVIAAVVALTLFSGVLDGLVGSPPKTGGSGGSPFSPFNPPAAVVVPTSIQDCENGGWQSYPQFADEEACKRFVSR
jgi:hypothetical protein